jgi:hypothetical protein
VTLDEAFVDPDRDQINREYGGQDLGGAVRQQNVSNQCTHQHADRPGPIKLEVEVPKPNLLPGRGHRARYHERDRRSDRDVHHQSMRHTEQRQEMQENRKPDDAAADAKQTRREARPEPDRHEHSDAHRRVFHGSPLL